MTTLYHTPHTTGAPLTAAEVNAPLGQLDAAINVLDKNFIVVHCTADGVTDNAARIQAAATAAGYGTTIYIATDNPALKIGIGSTVTFTKAGTRMVALNQTVSSWGTVFVALGGFGAASMFEWKTTGSSDFNVGIGASGFAIDMNNQTGHGMTVYRAYDTTSWSDIKVYNVADAYSAFRFIPQDTARASSTRVSQGIFATNLLGIHKNATATAPTFYLERVQESVFIGCKGWGGAGATAAGGYCFELVDCRGVQFYGCSAASSSSGGWNVVAKFVSAIGISIVDPTYELVNGLFIRTGAPIGTPTYSAATTYADGDVVLGTAAGLSYVSIQAGNLNHTPSSSPTWWTPTQVQQLSQRNPRLQSPTGATYSFDQMTGSTVETGSSTVVLTDNCNSGNHVISTRPDLVTLGAGITNTCFGTAYYNAGKLYAPTIMAGGNAAAISSAMYLGAAGTLVITGTGSPAGVVVANPGSLYLRTDGGAGTTLYVKESLTTSGGWVAK